MTFFIENENCAKKNIIFTIIITKTWCGRKKQCDILTDFILGKKKNKIAGKNTSSPDQTFLIFKIKYVELSLFKFECVKLICVRETLALSQ